MEYSVILLSFLQSKHEVILGGAVHKLCSDACFQRFRTVHNLSMAGCANCGSFCHIKPLMLKLEDSSKTVCNIECLAKYKEVWSEIESMFKLWWYKMLLLCCNLIICILKQGFKISYWVTKKVVVFLHFRKRRYPSLVQCVTLPVWWQRWSTTKTAMTLWICSVAAAVWWHSWFKLSVRQVLTASFY